MRTDSAILPASERHTSTETPRPISISHARVFSPDYSTPRVITDKRKSALARAKNLLKISTTPQSRTRYDPGSQP